MASRLLALALILTCCTACPGYHLAGYGVTSDLIPEDVKTVGVPPFENRSDQPELDQRITEALVNEFVRRGRFEAVPTAEGADVVLEGELSSFRQEPVSFTIEGRFDRVQVIVTARVRLVRTSPEEVLWSQNHFVFREQYDVPETPEAEVDRVTLAIEDIAEGFARSVVTSILEGF